MRKVFFLFFFIKSFLHGCYNLVRLIFNGNLFKYKKAEKYIIQKIKQKKIEKVLIISGGSSLIENWEKINSYDMLILNSFNTLKNLDEKQLIEVSRKTVLYYQAPFHKPLNPIKFEENLYKTFKLLNSDCIKIYSLPYNRENFSCDENYINFRPYGYLDYFGFKVYNSTTGVLSIMNFLAYSGIKKIDILGLEMNWLKDFPRPINHSQNIFNGIIWCYQVFLQTKHFKKKFDKKNIQYNNLNKDSWFNYI